MVRRSKNSTVLLIDDAQDLLDLYGLALEDAGYSVLRASRGHVGYHAAVAEHPDVIILELMLPDVDGWVVCAWLKANPGTANIPVIVLTGRNDYDTPLSVLNANVTELLHKPCSVGRLANLLKQPAATSSSPGQGGS